MDRPTTILWLRRDLRLHDHPALVAAVDAVRTGGGALLPIFIWEPGLYSGARSSGNRTWFVRESLAELRALPWQRINPAAATSVGETVPAAPAPAQTPAAKPTIERTARYAASRVVVEYEQRTPVLEAEDALKDDAPRVVPGWDRNVIMQVPFANGDAAGAFAAADRVVLRPGRTRSIASSDFDSTINLRVWKKS